jgi:hydrogenase maturation protein HypF
VARLGGFRRAGRFEPVAMPGGAASIRDPWRMAAAYLEAAFGGEVPGGLDVVRRNQARWAGVLEVARAGVNSPATSSAGRLFDAVAALLGVRDAVNYEGQAAVELEQLADPAERSAYPASVTGARPFGVCGPDLVRAAVEDLLAGVDPGTIAARFHNGVAHVIAEGCRRVRDEAALTTVALSGGVFQNALLLERSVGLLEQDGFRVLVHSRVPPNDGGISLGQAAVAGALDEPDRQGD